MVFCTEKKKHCTCLSLTEAAAKRNFYALKMDHIQKNKKWKLLTLLVLGVIGLSALSAGYLFMKDPSGAVIGLTTAYLRNSPFNNYWVPGIVLFTMNGVMNVLAILSLLLKYKYYAQFILVQGLLLIGWIVIQIFMVRDFNFLHFFCLASGIWLMMAGFHFKKQRK